MNIQEITYLLLAERILANFDSKKYVDWAVSLLKNEFESENLIILAGLDSDTTEEKEKYFWKSIEELKIKIEKTDSELIDNYANFIAKQVIEGKVDVMAGLNKMLDIVRATDYSSKYAHFDLLDEDIDFINHSGTTLFNPGLNIENKEEFLKEEFRILLEMNNLNIDDSLRGKSYCLSCNVFEEPDLKTKYQFKKPHKYQIWICRKCGSSNIEHSNSHYTKRKIIEQAKNAQNKQLI